MTLAPTPGQTVGPFFHYALPYAGDSRLVPPGAPGAVRLRGTVYDGAGNPVPDALLELWQADAEGRVVQRPGSLRRDGFDFTGFGRCATDNEGRYSFSTVTPGAPFFSLAILARGLLHRLITRAYLPGATDALPGGSRTGPSLDPPGSRRGDGFRVRRAAAGRSGDRLLGLSA